jgi:hypothetical protein
MHNFGVGEPFEFGFGIQSPRVSAARAKGLAHRPTGDVGVEQDLHPCPA